MKKNLVLEVMALLGYKNGTRFDLVEWPEDYGVYPPYTVLEDEVVDTDGDPIENRLLGDILTGEIETRNLLTYPWHPRIGEQYYYVSPEGMVKGPVANHGRERDTLLIYIRDTFSTCDEASANVDSVVNRFNRMRAEAYGC